MKPLLSANWAGFALALTLGWSAIAAGGALTAAQQRGQQLYSEGVAASGSEVRAEIGSAGMTLPGSALPCSNCHGSDAHGRPEGGVLPSDIRRQQLTKSYGVRSASGRRYPPYQLADFTRAVREGIDPAGNRLDSAMPRYQIGDAELAELWAYLEVVDRLAVPGVDEQTIRIATLLPTPDAEGVGQDMARVISGYFDEINAIGGIYGRKLELLVEPLDRSAAEPALAAAEKLYARQPVFAVVSPVTMADPTALSRWAEQNQVPLIAPYSSRNGAADQLSRFSFYLLSDTAVRLRVLLESAAKAAKKQHGSALALLDLNQLNAIGLSPAELRTDGVKIQLYDGAQPPLQRYLAEEPPAALVHFGDPALLRQLLEILKPQSDPPAIYALADAGMSAWRTAAEGYPGRIELAYPMLQSDLSPGGWRGFNGFRNHHRLKEGPLQPLLHAYVASQLTVEVLKRAGKQLDREGLIGALEQLYRYESGLMPPFTFGPNRHIGAFGAHLVDYASLASGGKPSSHWVELQDYY